MTWPSLVYTKVSQDTTSWIHKHSTEPWEQQRQLQANLQRQDWTVLSSLRFLLSFWNLILSCYPSLLDHRGLGDRLLLQPTVLHCCILPHCIFRLWLVLYHHIKTHHVQYKRPRLKIMGKILGTIISKPNQNQDQDRKTLSLSSSILKF